MVSSSLQVVNEQYVVSTESRSQSRLLLSHSVAANKCLLTFSQSQRAT